MTILSDPKISQAYLFKLQGYLMKVRDSFESLPCNNAYNSLSAIFYKKANLEDGIYIDQVKPALHGIALIASRNAVYIQQRSGVRARLLQSKLTHQEISIRIEGSYSHRPVKAYKCEKFSDAFIQYVRNTFSQVETEKLNTFLKDINEDLNTYLYNLWLGLPNRDDDLEKLNTLLNQTEKVLDEIKFLIDMVIEQPFADPYAKDKLKIYVRALWELFFCTKEAINEIQVSKANYKQFEFSFIGELVHNYKGYLNLTPSADNRRGEFMNFISFVEDELDSVTNQNREKNRFGRQLVAKAIKNTI